MVDIPAIPEDMSFEEIEAFLQRLIENQKYNRIDFFKPYDIQNDFIEMGATKKQRLLLAGNQLGKSEIGGYETARHLTGLYPSDWNGRVFEGPTNWWAAGVSTTLVRDIQQTKLCGEPGVDELFGTGFIPRHCFHGKPTLARGAVANAYDTCAILHFRPSHQARTSDPTDDGISQLQFKSYEQGPTKFQGKTLNGGIWWDEEPPEDVYREGEARMNATEGISFLTFTPLKGYTKVVAEYLEKESPQRGVIRFRADQCPHITPEKLAENKLKYPEHEWDARFNGEPKLGQGAIFRTPEEFMKFPITQMIPPHWGLLWGIDFGITHPFAAVLAAYDREADCIYILHCYKAADALPIVHAQAIREIAARVPVAWPHDGHAREKGTGESLSKVYKALDLNMLPTHAHFIDGSISTEACVLEMQQRFASGRLKVREDQESFFVETRSYHRDEDGNIVKVRDDLISATMKIIMQKRSAKPVELGWAAAPDHRFQRNARPQNRGRINPWTGRRED